MNYWYFICGWTDEVTSLNSQNFVKISIKVCLINLLEKIKCGLCCDQVRGYGPKSMRCRATNQSRRNGVLRRKLECSRDGYGYWWPPHVFSVSIAIVRRPLLMRTLEIHAVATYWQKRGCRIQYVDLNTANCRIHIAGNALRKEPQMAYILCMLI